MHGDSDDRPLDSTSINRRYTPTGAVESFFRQQVRDILGLDWSTHDRQILAELMRLKALEATCQASQ